MHLKQIIDESVGDYKETSMLLIAPECAWKCVGCHNTHLLKLITKNFPDEEILERFQKNPLSKAIVLGGLEPFDCMEEVRAFLQTLRESNIVNPKPTVIIYTGYDFPDIEQELIRTGLDEEMKKHDKVLLKYGGYLPGYNPTYNPLLGINLASPNQQVMEYSRWSS